MRPNLVIPHTAARFCAIVRDMDSVEVERDGRWWPGVMGLWREDERGWVATVRYATESRRYTETVGADRLRTTDSTSSD
jgi:hypothetical protein